MAAELSSREFLAADLSIVRQPGPAAARPHSNILMVNKPPEIFLYNIEIKMQRCYTFVYQYLVRNHDFQTPKNIRIT